MIIYNTTFHIQADILAESLRYLRQIYIPKAMASGQLHTPALRRILHAEEDGGESYALQFCVSDMSELTAWAEVDGGALQQALVQRFGNKMVGFSTLMEDISLDD